MNNPDRNNNRKRDYLNGIGETPPTVQIDTARLAEDGVVLSEIFFHVTRELRKRYNISKGVLVVRHDSTHRLAAISTWNNGATRDGLAVNLPVDSSLFEKVAEHGSVYTEEYCGSFSGNFFERKLLLDDTSRSFVVQPLKSNGEVVGLLGYSSEEPTAFAMFDEGAMEKVAADLAGIIRSGRTGS